MFFLKLNRKINITISIINNLLLKTNDKTEKTDSQNTAQKIRTSITYYYKSHNHIKNRKNRKTKKHKKPTAQTQHKTTQKE